MTNGLADLDIEVCELPEGLRRLVEIIGLPAAITLAEKHGGTEILIPANYQPGHPLNSILGLVAAEKLIGRHAGEKLYIPKGDRALRCVRNRRIIEEYDDGDQTAASLAVQYRLTERQVRTILNNLEPTGHKGQLVMEFE